MKKVTDLKENEVIHCPTLKEALAICELIDKAYENYSKEYYKDNSVGLTLLVARIDGSVVYQKPDKEMFISMCTYDESFSQEWGLKIEERELSHQERFTIHSKNPIAIQAALDNKPLTMEETNVPTKLIIITYNNETIKSYE